MLRLLNLGPPALHIRRTIGSLAASSGMHALLLVGLAVAVVQVRREASPEPAKSALVATALPGGSDSAGIDGSLADATLPQPGESLTPLDETPSTVALEKEMFVTSTAATQSGSIGILPAQTSPPPRLAWHSAQEEADDEVETEPSDEPLAKGAPGGAGAGFGPAGHSFFGLEASGNKVVFVVDISGSMHGHRIHRAINELRHSIESLRRDQQFFVIFFSDDALPMPSEKLLPATPENVRQTIEWFKHVECGGGTNPLSGLLMALALKPDSIYLLTDGKFDPQVVWEVAQAEPSKPIPIFTISFAAKSAEKLLRTLAHETGGQYRFVR
jgi:hypothetical protein